QSKH
ncbi:hypothetical protein D046_6230B, partial [Vibrio parahaemolyticus V-223/04]